MKTPCLDVTMECTGVDVNITSYDPVNVCGAATVMLSVKRDGEWKCIVLVAHDVRRIFAAIPVPNPGAYAAIS